MTAKSGHSSQSRASDSAASIEEMVILDDLMMSFRISSRGMARRWRVGGVGKDDEGDGGEMGANSLHCIFSFHLFVDSGSVAHM